MRLRKFYTLSSPNPHCSCLENRERSCAFRKLRQLGSGFRLFLHVVANGSACSRVLVVPIMKHFSEKHRTMLLVMVFTIAVMATAPGISNQSSPTSKDEYHRILEPL
jgi:hypothetical protein